MKNMAFLGVNKINFLNIAELLIINVIKTIFLQEKTFLTQKHVRLLRVKILYFSSLACVGISFRTE
jgi:hypothetical protein